MMENLFNVILSLLAFCVSGVAILLIAVAIWITRDILIQKRSQNLNAKKCKYIRFSLLDDYQTGCGHDFHDATESGNPVTDWAKYCPYCGGEIDLK